MAAISAPRMTLADALLKEGLISRDQHDRALQEYERTKRSLIRILTDMGAINDNLRLEILRRSMNCDVVSLDNVIPSSDVAGYITREQCRRIHAVPLRLEAGAVLVAMEDPTDVRSIGDMEKVFGRAVRPVLASSKGIFDTIEKLSETSASAVEEVRPSLGYRLLSSLSLVAICFGPMIGFYFAILRTNLGGELYGSFALSPFENVLFFLVVWGSWAAIAYFLNDMIFGKSQS